MDVVSTTSLLLSFTFLLVLTGWSFVSSASYQALRMGQIPTLGTLLPPTSEVGNHAVRFHPTCLDARRRRDELDRSLLPCFVLSNLLAYLGMHILLL